MVDSKELSDEDAAQFLQAYDVQKLREDAKGLARRYSVSNRIFKRENGSDDPFAGTSFISADNVIH